MNATKQKHNISKSRCNVAITRYLRSVHVKEKLDFHHHRGGGGGEREMKERHTVFLFNRRKGCLDSEQTVKLDNPDIFGSSCQRRLWHWLGRDNLRQGHGLLCPFVLSFFFFFFASVLFVSGGARDGWGCMCVSVMLTWPDSRIMYLGSSRACTLPWKSGLRQWKASDLL